MATTVVDMTQQELHDMIADLIEQKLAELLGDPDEGLRVRKSLHGRLLRQRMNVARGERGDSLDDVARRFSIAHRRDICRKR